VPQGVAGELFIGGVGVARGYLNRPGLTEERFLTDSFVENGRMYKTGDVARWLPDGNIEFIGRNDYQVQIRGFRIELGEVETALKRHEAVCEVVAIVREDSRGEKCLVAYIVPSAGEHPTVNEMYCFSREKLPDYMVPSAFVLLDALPLTSNGKVNRKALPAPDTLRHGLEEELDPPRTSSEETLVGIWTDILQVERIGIYDNFFQLGGHSLLATQVMSRARHAFQTDMPLRVLFEAPTIAGLAAAFDGSRREGASIPSVAVSLEDFEEGRL
jgi:hypothetical protein